MRAASLAAASLAVVTLIKLVAFDFIGPATPFLLYFVSIIVATWFGGWLWGLAATLVSALLGTYFFMPPFHSLVVHDAATAVRSTVFLVEGIAITWIVATHRSSQASATHAAEGIRLHREWLSTTLRSIGDAVIAADPAGNIVLMNLVAEDLTGWTSEQAIGRPLEEIFSIFDSTTNQPLSSPLEDVRRQGKAVGLSQAALLRSRAGKAIPIEDSAAPIRAADDELLGTVLVFRDVSRRRADERRNGFISRATEELASSLDYKQTLATMARLAVPAVADWCAIDLLEGEELTRVAVQHVDPEKIRLVYAIQKEYPEDRRSAGGAYEIVRTGKPLYLPSIPDDLLVAAAKDERHLALIRQLQLRAYIGVPLMANGVVIGVLTLAMAESGRNYDEKDLALAMALADRSTMAVNHARLFAENVEARAAAERANRTKDEFLAMLGHELRNPLAPILTTVQLMRLRTPGLRDREQEILERHVKHVVALVDDLLDIARITKGKIQHEQKPVDLHEAITRALEVTESLINERHHVVTTNIDRALMVNGDAVRLTQVFINLITNAAKYTPDGGKIHIGARREATRIVARIIDNGAGVNADLLPQLFDLFVQGNQALDRSKGGLGLGLAIVRSLVQLHGGEVSVHSEGPGLGSEFVVALPAIDVQTSAAEAAEPLAAAENGARQIMVVDDNQDALELLGEALTLMGYDTHTASTPLAALELAERVRPHVALLDIGLPDMDGYELAKRIRHLPGLQNIRLVALTGYGQPADIERSKGAGFDEHLVKPASLDRIRKVVGRLTKSHGP